MSMMANALRQPRFLIPLILFVTVVGFFAAGMRLDSTLVPSPLIGKAAPRIDLPVLNAEGRRFVSDTMKGRPWILNVWASWCAACLEEHDLLIAMKYEMDMPIVGLNYKDAGEDARNWLARRGDPYLLTAVDAQGSQALDWGVYGVPETFVIDAEGLVRFKHVGPLTEKVLAEEIAPLMRGHG